MNSKDLIISKIDELVANFPMIQVRYQYDGDHIVEVVPSSMLTGNEVFQDAINDIFLELDEEYMEDLMFVTEGDLIKVKNVTYEKRGEFYLGNIPREKLAFFLGLYKMYASYLSERKREEINVSEVHTAVKVNYAGHSVDLSSSTNIQTVGEASYAMAA